MLQLLDLVLCADQFISLYSDLFLPPLYFSSIKKQVNKYMSIIECNDIFNRN